MMMAKYLIVLLIHLFVLLTPPEDYRWFTVFVLYDVDGDGKEEGVGPNVRIDLRADEELTVIGFTDEFSQHDFYVPRGIYHVEAHVKSTRLFFVWVCEDSKDVQKEPRDYLILHCRERFFLRLPFAIQAGVQGSENK